MAHEELGDTMFAPDVPKSPRMSWSKKDKQTMGLVHISLRNPRFGKLSMEEKGKAIIVESYARMKTYRL